MNCQNVFISAGSSRTLIIWQTSASLGVSVPGHILRLDYFLLSKSKQSFVGGTRELFALEDMKNHFVIIYLSPEVVEHALRKMFQIFIPLFLFQNRIQMYTLKLHWI